MHNSPDGEASRAILAHLGIPTIGGPQWPDA